MKLEQILAFHPGEGATADALQAGLDAAQATRGELLQTAAAADRVRSEGLLTADDKALLAAEQDAQKARRAVDRIDALLPKIRADLHVAGGREAVAELRAMAAGVQPFLDRLARWQVEGWPEVSKLLSEGMKIESEAHSVVGMYRELVAMRCKRQDVIDALAGQKLPDPQVPDAGPATLFAMLAGVAKNGQ